MKYKRATQKLRDAGIKHITIYRRLYGAAPEDDRWERQTSRCFKTPLEAAQAVIDGFRPVHILPQD